MFNCIGNIRCYDERTSGAHQQLTRCPLQLMFSLFTDIFTCIVNN